MINGELPFNMYMAPSLHLSVGQTISYLSYRHVDGQIKVRRIIEIVEENWNEPVTARLQYNNFMNNVNLESLILGRNY